MLPGPAQNVRGGGTGADSQASREAQYSAMLGKQEAAKERLDQVRFSVDWIVCYFFLPPTVIVKTNEPHPQ